MGTLDRPVGTSVGAHALTRTLPAGLAVGWGGPELVSFAREIAVTTHAVEAADVAAVGAMVVTNLAQGNDLHRAVLLAQRECAPHVGPAALSVADAALAAAVSHPGQTDMLRKLAPDRRASSALAGGIYVAMSFPEPEQVREALLFAASVSDHVATAAGALLGTKVGAAGLPVDLVSRLELAWVADVLARDMISEFMDSPSGYEYGGASDPTWWNRYPGW